MIKKIGIVALCVVLLLCGYLFLEMNTVFSAKEQVELKIVQGDHFNNIVSQLKEQKVIQNKLLFKIYSKLTRDVDTILPGTVVIPKGANYSEILKQIQKPSFEEVTVTIPEGFELREIADRLESHGLIDRDKFYAVVQNGTFDFPFLAGLPATENRLEGFLFPDTYVFSKIHDDETTIIKAMLKRFDEIYRQIKIPTDMTDYEIITLASIIEREGKPESFELVSSVFHNRLNRKDHLQYLQSCATVQYVLKERKSILSEKDTKIDSPYNTYRYPGLPKGPIASPGKAAIQAALHPAQTKYLYFLNDQSGKLHFSSSLEEHQKQMKQYGLN